MSDKNVRHTHTHNSVISPTTMSFVDL